jgi:hypothetical protein
MQHANDTYLLSGDGLSTTKSVSRFTTTYNRTWLPTELANDGSSMYTHVLTGDRESVSLNQIQWL